MAESFLAVERLLIDRLRAKVAGAQTVLSAADLAGVEESKQTTPALHVLFGRLRPTRQQEGSRGRVQEYEVTWWVVVAVRNVRSAKTGEDAREEAGPILGEVLQALLGWQPAADHTPFEAAASPSGGFSKGFGYFPLAFATRVVARGEP